MPSKPRTAPLASDVRDFLNADPKRIASLSPEAQKTVAPGARGRLHKEAIARYNKGRKNPYVLGVGRQVKAAKDAQRQALIEAGLAGTRGPLNAAAKEFLAQPKG